jgi:hypothetical protein
VSEQEELNSPAALWQNVLQAQEANAVSVASVIKAVEGIVQSVDRLAVAMTHRPTRKETGGFFALMLVVMVGLNVAAITLGTVVLRGGQRQIAECVGADTSTDCQKRGADKTGAAVRGIQCVVILLDGQRPPACEKEAMLLQQAGVVLP